MPAGAEPRPSRASTAAPSRRDDERDPSDRAAQRVAHGARVGEHGQRSLEAPPGPSRRASRAPRRRLTTRRARSRPARSRSQARRVSASSAAARASSSIGGERDRPRRGRLDDVGRPLERHEFAAVRCAHITRIEPTADDGRGCAASRGRTQVPAAAAATAAPSGMCPAEGGDPAAGRDAPATPLCRVTSMEGRRAATASLRERESR